MNIFEVLSQGKSRLHEPSMSAMLAYLLDSNMDHGLGEAFIRIFLDSLDNEVFGHFLSSTFIKSTVELEAQYSLNGSRKDIDIEILLSGDNEDGDFKIIIENKIKTSSANPKQLSDYYNAIIQDDPNIKSLYVIFLTPESTSLALKAEFENLHISSLHHKKWLFWNSNQHASIVNMVKNLLNLESSGEINPINEYMRHTLKAFIKHSSIVTNAKDGKQNRSKMRVGQDLGEITERAEIKLNDETTYEVLRRDSTQIQVFKIDTGEKEPAKTILARFIDENNLQIPYAQLTTRQTGSRFFQWYNENLKSFHD